MLIKDIEPIKDIGIDLLKKQNADEIIDKIIEAPLRSACKILRQKGIKTVMSSANKNNVLQPGEKRKEKEDVKDDWMYCCDTSFIDAGCILSYNNRYPESTIIVRMPVTEQTTADEVEEYFVKFAEVLKEQNKEKEFEDEER